MKASRLSKLAMAAVAALMMAVQAKAQYGSNQATQGPAPAPAVAKRVIIVSLEDRKLALLEDGQVKRVYSVAVGKPSTPSPVGAFTIERRVANPIYRHNGKTIQPGPGNPVGTRWMGLSIHGYGIHGTNEPRSIGKAVSHGCVRMARADLEELYGMVAEGDTVELVGQRNEETAQLFGGEVNPAAPTAAPATVVAAATAPEPVPATNAASTEKTVATDRAVATAMVPAELR